MKQIGHIKSNNNYSMLKCFIDKHSELSYNNLVLLTPASDLIKLFQERCDKFSDEEYWKNLAHSYIMQNYKKIPYKVYYELFSSKRPKREYLMSEEEHSLLNKLPQQVKIFRGGTLTEQKTKKYGISWTLNQQIATNFANVKAIRDKKEMVVIEKIIEKKDIIAFFTERNEDEIIYIGNSTFAT
ncbi:MAG: hypothetical protein WAP48_10395 [Sediminibacterium sp.]